MMKSGYIKAFEASDGGTGNPLNTIWTLSVDGARVTTTNERLAETARLAITTASRVDVEFDLASDVISEIRMEFKYVCTAELVQECHQTPPPPFGSKYVCETKRFAPCEQGELG
jgi:hypothetical protein